MTNGVASRTQGEASAVKIHMDISWRCGMVNLRGVMCQLTSI